MGELKRWFHIVMPSFTNIASETNLPHILEITCIIILRYVTSNENGELKIKKTKWRTKQGKKCYEYTRIIEQSYLKQKHVWQCIEHNLLSDTFL